MSLDPSNIGRTFAASEPYVVSRETIHDFAVATGERSPICHDPVAARAAGHVDVVAPVTFPIVVTLNAMGAAVTDPSVGVDWSRVVHGDQRFQYMRPIVAGDELMVHTVIESIKTLAGNDMITLRGDLLDAAGLPIGSTWTSLVQRGE
jgi:acyl dehydratase